MPYLRHDEHRLELGFLSVAEVDALTQAGVRVLDPFSTLISAGVLLGPDTVIYPGVVIQRSGTSKLVLGTKNVLYPGAFLLAERGGSLVIGDQCELGPGVVQVKANLPGSDIKVGNEVRLLNGCELTGAASWVMDARSSDRYSRSQSCWREDSAAMPGGIPTNAELC